VARQEGIPAMKNIYVWYSKRSEDGAKELIHALKMHIDTNVTSGSLPAKGFDGHLVCWGPSIQKNFSWKSRNFRSITNDPRLVKRFNDRTDLRELLAENQVESVPWCKLLPGANLDNVHTLLGVTSDSGRVMYATTTGGGKSQMVLSQTQLDMAISNGLTRAFAINPTNTRTRMFVTRSVSKSPTFSATLESTEDLTFLRSLVSDNKQAKDALERLCVNAHVKSEKKWKKASPDTSRAAVSKNICQILDLNFCTVEFVGNSVLSVYTSPSKESMTEEVSHSFANEIMSKVNSIESDQKVKLQTVAAEATEEEAAAILSLLSRVSS
jgi:hypothetical protein